MPAVVLRPSLVVGPAKWALQSAAALHRPIGLHPGGRRPGRGEQRQRRGLARRADHTLGRLDEGDLREKGGNFYN